MQASDNGATSAPSLIVVRSPVRLVIERHVVTLQGTDDLAGERGTSHASHIVSRPNLCVFIILYLLSIPHHLPQATVLYRHPHDRNDHWPCHDKVRAKIHPSRSAGSPRSVDLLSLSDLSRSYRRQGND